MRSRIIILLAVVGGGLVIGGGFWWMREADAPEVEGGRVDGALGRRQEPRIERGVEAGDGSLRMRQPLFQHPPAIPESMGVLLGGHGEGLIARQDFLKSIQSLSEGEAQAMLFFLQTSPDEANLPADELNAVKNEVVNVLKRQMGDPGLLIRQLLALYAVSQDEVWRDYCVQHAGTLVERADSVAREDIMALLWNAADQKSGCLAGTALIALVNNRDASAVGGSRVADKALAVAQDETYGEGSRITALQIGAKLDDRRMLIPARAIAASSGSVPLRVSAIATLGALGEASDLPLLEKYAVSSDIRLHHAASTALSRSKRNAIPSDTKRGG